MTMFVSKKMKLFVFSIMVMSVVTGLTGCSTIPFLSLPTETPTITPIPPTDTPQPTPTPVTPTATPAPTETATPTVTPLPPLAVVPDGINPFCLTKKYFISHIDGPAGPASMPEFAQAGAVDKKTGTINFPISAIDCTLVLTFNQPVPSGMKLQVWDARPQEPFIVYDMPANPSNPKEAYAVMTHSYIVDPPKWWMDYTIVVITADGNEVFRAPIHVQKPLPEKCWDDSYPDPITLFCPIMDS